MLLNRAWFEVLYRQQGEVLGISVHSDAVMVKSFIHEWDEMIEMLTVTFDRLTIESYWLPLTHF